MQKALFNRTCRNALIPALLSIQLSLIIAPSCYEKVNLPPQIARVSPQQDTATLYTFNSYSFSVTAEDPEGFTVTVRWDIDGSEFAEGYTISVNLGEEYAGREVELRAVANDGSRTSSVSWKLQVLSPLYLTHYMIQQVVSPSSVSGIFSDEKLRKWVETHMEEALKISAQKYSGDDFDGDGIDDAIFIETRGKPLLAFLKLLDTLQNFTSLADYISDYHNYRRPGIWLKNGVPPGSSCTILFTPSSLLWSFGSQILKSLSSQAGELRKYALPLVQTGENFSIPMKSEYTLPFNEAEKLRFYGSLDGEDVVMMVALEELIGGVWNYLQAYYPDTWRGLLSLFIDPCYYMGPWADRENFPDFSRIITSPSEALSTAREHLFYFFYFASYFLSQVAGEGDTPSTFFISQGTLFTPYLHNGRNLGLNGFNWGNLSESFKSFAKAISSGSPFPLTQVFQTDPAYTGVFINPATFFQSPLPLNNVLPLYVSGEGFSEGSNTPSSGLYDLPEPFIDSNFNGIRDPDEPFEDMDGNGAFTEGDSFIDSSWPNGVRDGAYTPPGAFYYESEVPVFYDVGSDGIPYFSSNYTGPDTDGSEGNGLYDQGEPCSSSCTSPASVTHTWPDGRTTDPDNRVIDYIYLFYPDPTFNGVITAPPSFDPDGDGALSNGDINAVFNTIYLKLGSSQRYKK